MGIAFYAVVEYKMNDSYFHFAELDISGGDAFLPAIVYGKGGVKDEILYEPRGIPFDSSYKVTYSFFTNIGTIETFQSQFKLDEEEEFSIEEYLEMADDWIVERFKKNGLLPAPELFDAGWLNLRELHEVLEHEKISLEELTPEFRAAFAAMRSLSNDFGLENVRLIFWCSL